MEKNRLTKELLADVFHELLLKKEFEKITIKNITDQAGVIRPTFYYHFQDKYDVLEFILCRDIIEPMDQMVQEKREKDAIRFMFQAFEQDLHFYQRAFRVTGQNAFEDMLYEHLQKLLENRIGDRDLAKQSGIPRLTKRHVSKYYAIGLTSVVKSWMMEHKNEATAEELYSAYEYLLTRSIYEIIGEME